MDLQLADKNAVVTGGSSGIGLATADVLLGEGMRVAICGRDEDRLTSAVETLAAKHGGERVVAVACDVTKSEQMQRFADRVSSAFGAVDLLVNNAGQARISTFKDTTDEAWREELELKFFSQINSLRAFEPMLRKTETPAIVGVNSLLALQPEAHMVCTSAARAGVQSLLKSLSVELAPQIRVNTIALGLVVTGQQERRYKLQAKDGQSADDWFKEKAMERKIPLQRLGRSLEVANAIAFLGSPIAGYITGATLEISGGVSRFI